jgi:hypothetical protein
VRTLRAEKVQTAYSALQASTHSGNQELRTGTLVKNVTTAVAFYVPTLLYIFVRVPINIILGNNGFL